MKILAFESSCDETSCAVVSVVNERFTVKSNIVASQIETHKLYGGVVPEIASRAHVEAISKITYEALAEANTALSEIDLVAVTANPGLIGALLVGVNFAKGLAVSNNIPLVAVDHMKGHIAASLLDEDVPKPPFIALTASGGHTSIYLVRDYIETVEIGRTRDDAIGEAFDKIGRILGIPYPAGRGFDELSERGFIEATGDEKNFYEKYKLSDAYRNSDFALPSPALSGDTLDFSFSGLKTAAINTIHKYSQRKEEINKPLFAAHYTYMVVEAVAKKLSLALERNEVSSLVISGGVAANSHLRRRLRSLAEEKRVKLYIPKPSLCGDNAAMIAAAGYYEYKRGAFKDASLNASALDSI